VITVLRAGPLTTVQDRGRPGYAHLGVPRSGALDGPAMLRANALVGNPPDAAVLETTLMGCALRFEVAARVTVTGADAVVRVDREPVEGGAVVEVPAGAVLDIGRARRGVRSYLAVTGGLDVEPVLGSRSTDTLSGLGPPKLADGMTLPIGAGSPIAVTGSPHAAASSVGAAGLPAGAAGLPAGAAASSVGATGLPAGAAGLPAGGAAGLPAGSVASAAGGAAAPSPSGDLVLGVRLGPRDDWFVAAGLFSSAYAVSPLSNRVGCRLAGSALTRTLQGELSSEGVVLGAVQVPANGEPLIFLADHPTTGGYPVIGVVGDVTPLAQARPGTTVRFRELD
jgi:allophanate hydrolase subunit 2